MTLEVNQILLCIIGVIVVMLIIKECKNNNKQKDTFLAGGGAQPLENEDPPDVGLIVGICIGVIAAVGLIIAAVLVSSKSKSK